MKVEELPDDFTPEQFMQLDAESLNQLPYSVHKLYCGFKKCTNGTHVRDYGISPHFLYHSNSKYFLKHPDDYWLNVNKKFHICSKHWQVYSRISKIYGEGAAQQKLVDFASINSMSGPIIEINKGVEQIEGKL